MHSAHVTRLDCIVVGVGGQGVVLASRLVADACMARGSFVRTAETIGMSQRGGSVASHVRVAPSPADLPSSMVPAGAADLLLAFEPGEALRAFDRLGPCGAAVVSSRPVVSASVASGGYDGRAQLGWLAERLGTGGGGRLAVVDPSALESAGLSPRSLNVMLLGAAVGMGALPLGEQELADALRRRMRPSLVEPNLRALALGIAAGSGGA